MKKYHHMKIIILGSKLKTKDFNQLSKGPTQIHKILIAKSTIQPTTAKTLNPKPNAI
jgi:hypothetical protein